MRSADSSKAAPAAEWGKPRHLIGDFYRHRRGDWPHCRFTRSVSRRGIWFGHDHDCRGLGFQEQTSPATPTPRRHQPATSGTDGRAELEAAAKLRDEEAEILLSTRDREIKNASEKYDPKSKSSKHNLLNPKPPSKNNGTWINRSTRMPAGVPSPPGTRTEALNDRLGLEHLKQRADLHQRQEQESNELQTLRQNALETVEKSC